MPIIKSAIKRMKQNRVRRSNNKHYGSHMKSMIKLLLGYVEKGEMEKAKKILPEVVASIDTAAKKKIIHENNAAHKKSRVQRALNAGPAVKAEKVAKPAKKTEKAEVKTEAKVEEKKEEGNE
ncbi:MAG: 30S ribosomal protein S20 [Candidatus Peregrinibacteria bacterium]|nr:30S ribosomal protein S20 [Candidatus Peregrinibacteria bacterium]